MEAHTQPLSRTATRTSAAPSALGGALLITGLGLTLWAWDAAVPDPARHQIFLSLWLLGALLLAVRHLCHGVPTLGWRVPNSAMAFGIGVVGAAAVATMPWSDLGSVFWYQLWFTGPLVAGLTLAALSPSNGVPARHQRAPDQH